MTNLIQNSNWQQLSPQGGPLNFSSTGPVTFDNYSANCNRTCSVTMASGTASDMYNLPIDVTGCCNIRFGYSIRAIEAASIKLCADFTDAKGTVIASNKVPIEKTVKAEFRARDACFSVPAGATSVKLSMVFEGKVTACTFGAPYAVCA